VIILMNYAAHWTMINNTRLVICDSDYHLCLS
jgi:hypothetical protein